MKKIEVCLDLTSLYNRKITGLERLALMIFDMIKDVPNIQCTCIYRKKKYSEFVDGIVINCNSRFITEQLLIPLKLSNKKFDYVIFPVFPPSLLVFLFKRRDTKIVTCVIDTVAWNFSETLSLKAKLYFKPQIKLAALLSDNIWTMLNCIKDEIIQINSNYENKIEVIGGAIEESKFNNELDTYEFENSELKKSENSDFLITVGTLEPRKNLLYLINVFQEFNKNKEYKLIIIGRQGWENRDLILKNIDSGEDIVFSGFISDEDLKLMYKKAKAFITLPVYEGFGLTPFEAIACGTVPIVSDISAFRETLGDQGYFIELNDVKKAALQLEKHLMNELLIPQNIIYNMCNFRRNLIRILNKDIK